MSGGADLPKPGKPTQQKLARNTAQPACTASGTARGLRRERRHRKKPLSPPGARGSDTRERPLERPPVRPGQGKASPVQASGPNHALPAAAWPGRRTGRSGSPQHCGVAKCCETRQQPACFLRGADADRPARIAPRENLIANEASRRPCQQHRRGRGSRCCNPPALHTCPQTVRARHFVAADRSDRRSRSAPCPAASADSALGARCCLAAPPSGQRRLGCFAGCSLRL